MNPTADRRLSADPARPDRALIRRSVLAAPALSRRRFLAIAGGIAAAGATGCSHFSGTTASSGSALRQTTPPTSGSAQPGAVAATGTVTATGVVGASDVRADDRVLVVVTLAGGNDAVNTLIPTSGRYQDLRPSIHIDEADRLAVDAMGDYGLHPSLAPLVPRVKAGSIGFVAGVGFPEPDRSHFVSTDRWARADRMDEHLGWIGRWLDSLVVDGTAAGSPDIGLSTLTATALGGSPAMTAGSLASGVSVGDVDAFAYPSAVDHADIRRLAGGTSETGAAAGADDDPLRNAARTAFLTSVGAVEEFDEIADAVRSGDQGPPSGPFSNGLAVAAELINSHDATRVVTITASGFDTHSQQLGQHADLLDDLATGLDEFWATIEASGNANRVLVITTSEFGRRLAENGSGGTDHGSAGLSLIMGTDIVGGVHGALDLDDIIDGDLRPVIDPRTLYTAALDWLGGDAERVLGQRWDDVALVRA